MRNCGTFEGMQRYYPFSQFLRKHLGEVVHKVCIDADLSCPNIDGTVATGGCIYCDNASFSPVRRLQREDISRQIEEGIQRLKRRYGAGKYIAYFQSFSNTHAPLRELQRLCDLALSHPGMVGLDVATRPDCIDSEKLAYFERIARDRMVILEYGLQSSHDETLRWINRGHDYNCLVRAVHASQGRGLFLCVHVILGFPCETEDQMLSTADRVAALPIDLLKIHDLHIVRGTPLARLYEISPFPMRNREQYIDLLCRFLERIPPGVAIQRLFSFTPRHLLVAPLWNTHPNNLWCEIRSALTQRNTWQGRLYGKP